MERAEAGDIQARYMAAVMQNNIDNNDRMKEWLAQNISAGDLCSLFRGSDEDYYPVKRGDLKNHVGKLTALADDGDKYKNYAKVIDYYRRLIELGAACGYEEYHITKMYLEDGNGITANHATAREWMIEENPY